MTDLRASYEERDKYLSKLADNYAEGRLDDLEYEKRRDALLAGVTHDDLLAQFQGLPNPGVLVPARGKWTARAVSKPEPDASKRAKKGSGAVVAGAVIAAVFALLGSIIAISGAQTYDATMDEDVAYVAPVEDIDAARILHEGLDRIFAAGYTKVANVNVIDGTVFGVTTNDSGVASSFSADQSGSMEIWQEEGAVVDSWIPIEDYREQFEHASNLALENGLVGDVINVMEYEDGEPGIELAIATSQGVGSIVVDASGNIIQISHP